MVGVNYLFNWSPAPTVPIVTKCWSSRRTRQKDAHRFCWRTPYLKSTLEYLSTTCRIFRQRILPDPPLRSNLEAVDRLRGLVQALY
jgi:hypothetical protein